MSGTPIFELLYRDYVEADKAWPEDVTRPPVVGESTVPARSTLVTGDVLVYELEDHLPLELAELTSQVGGRADLLSARPPPRPPGTGASRCRSRRRQHVSRSSTTGSEALVGYLGACDPVPTVAPGKRVPQPLVRIS